MLQTLGLILPEALAIAYNPITFMLVVVLILSEQARKKTTAYVAGWVIGLGLLCYATYLFMTATKFSPFPPDKQNYGLQLVLGLILAGMAISEFRQISAPKTDARAHFPWGNRVEYFAPAEVFGVGFLMAGLNLKNAVLIVAAYTSIDEAGGVSTPAWGVILLITIIGSLTTLVPWLLFVIKGPQVKEKLHGWMEWLIINHALVLFILFTFFSAKLTGNAVAGLF